MILSSTEAHYQQKDLESHTVSIFVTSSMQVKRRGKYKTGEIFMRKDMSPEEQEVYTALQDGMHEYFVSRVAKVCTL